MLKAWGLNKPYTKVTLKYDLYVDSLQTTVAKAGETLSVSRVENGNPYVTVAGWDDLEFFVHATLVATVVG